MKAMAHAYQRPRAIRYGLTIYGITVDQGVEVVVRVGSNAPLEWTEAQALGAVKKAAESVGIGPVRLMTDQEVEEYQAGELPEGEEIEG